jgi:hypothetical protein
MSQNPMMMIPPEQLQYLQAMRRAEQVMMASQSSAASNATSLGPPQLLGGRMPYQEFGTPRNMMTNAPYIPQDRLDPRFSLTATQARHLQGTMNTQSDMLRSMLRRQEEEGVLLLRQQQQERILSMERPGHFALPPAKRRHVDTDQWGPYNAASQAERLAQLEAQMRSMPKPPKVRQRHVKSFPIKLMQAITDYYDETIVAWLPDGKSFVVVDTQAFCDMMLSKAFRGGKYVSFVRKLNRWGFNRLISGTGMDCFHHALFQRDRMDLCALIKSRNPNSAESTGIDSALLQSIGNPSLEGIEKYFEYATNKGAAKEPGSSLKDGDK